MPPGLWLRGMTLVYGAAGVDDVIVYHSRDATHSEPIGEWLLEKLLSD